MLGHFFRTFLDQGSRSFRKLRLLSSICLGISVSRSSKYWYVLSPLAFAVSDMLNIIALAFAPLEESIRTKFLRAIVNGSIACSA